MYLLIKYNALASSLKTDHLIHLTCELQQQTGCEKQEMQAL